MASKAALAEISIKRCSACANLRHFSEFARRANGFCGVGSECISCVKVRMTAWRKANADRCLASKRAWKERNADRHRAADLLWKQANPDRIKESRQRQDRKRASDPMYRLHSRIRCGIRDCLTGRRKGRRTFDLMGCTVEELRAHLERQFVTGMTWQNMGDWHIDHIIPKSSFHIVEEGDAQFARCWALSNLRPVWAAENHRKHCKIEFLC